MITSKISIGSDHAGFELKESIIAILKELGLEVLDRGTYSPSESVDYPDYGKYTAQDVIKGDCLGILICGSGIGISIAANKVNGIRAALCHDVVSAQLSRMHNNANILVLAGRPFNKERADNAADIVKAWLNTEFEGGRHQKRIDKITAIEIEESSTRV